MRTMGHARAARFAVGISLALLLVVPAVLAAEPSAPPSPPDHAREKAKAPKVEVTLNGTIERTTDDKGRPTFALTAGGTTYELSAGPKWFHGAGGGPLAEFVGRSVEVHGWQREGSTDVSVDTVDGERVLPEGRPPWAGGPRANGQRHPGWKPWKLWGSDERPARGLGREHAPGQLKEKPADADTSED